MSGLRVTIGAPVLVAAASPHKPVLHFWTAPLMVRKISLIESCCYPNCDRKRYSESDAPPFCGIHLVECAHYISKQMGILLLDPNREDRAPFAPAETPQDLDSVVYYVRLGDHVKIGTTVKLEQRLKSFYVDHNPDALLATEPGDRFLEALRHREFAAERVFKNRELFNPSPRLLAHIEELNRRTA